jgi:hypothetical protein
VVEAAKTRLGKRGALLDNSWSGNHPGLGSEGK